MSDVKRWEYVIIFGSMQLRSSGKYVLYTDYERDMKERVCRRWIAQDGSGWATGCGKTGMRHQGDFCQGCGGKVEVTLGGVV